MQIEKIVENIIKSKGFKDIFSEQNFLSKKEITVKTLNGSMKAAFAAAAINSYSKNALILVPTREEAENWLHDNEIFTNNKDITLLLEPKHNVRLQVEHLDEPVLWLIDGLSVIQKSESFIAITTPAIFDKRIPAPSDISQNRILIKKGQEEDYNNFINSLMENGYDRKDFVAVQGDISIRGAIVDIFPVGWDNPLRIEFFGNTIESIRQFDTLSQRSIREHESVEFMGNLFHQKDDENYSTIFDYIPKETLLIIDSPEEVSKTIDDFSIFSGHPILYINKLGEADFNIKTQSQPDFQSSIKNLITEIINLSNQGYTIYLSAEGKIHLERFKDLVENSLDIFQENLEDYSHIYFSKEELLNKITWSDVSPTAGFIYPEKKIALFTEHEIFGRHRQIESSTRKGSQSGISFRELKQLNIGDLLVHEDKGIGRFDGFQAIQLGGSWQDCVRMFFAEGDILYVQLNYIQKLQKYSSQEGIQPKLSKLGSTEWVRKRARTKKRLKDIARDLIKLYAERKMTPGFAFSADSIWQKEFEASFIYEDTPDQATTTTEMKKDMESDSPMDRLVCGDVGYGKTEIAIRAAFKAVQSGKQVAVLVPTTILAQQHFFTFADRLRLYPVVVEVISRFRSPAQQKEILEKLKQGKIDILIGTHRLLSKDVEFKELGLLIIDEEHRFGVGAKEKLRQMRVHIDTLTLTATPIPRTLNFSLLGARDMSVIETPPRNRIPVYTEISEWKDSVIRDAILREIDRNGQVFFVNDKVEDINKILINLKTLLPSLRFGVAHGQMKTHELESVMEKFIEKKLDVLIATKIVESGLDIPNANTMIINRSNHFGLAELYQLRGRVGRSNVQAYCYLVIPPAKTLSTLSLRRLQAIEEFTELGSGFQLALRDMEIRGAGNLLGAEQSGYINDIGFELFHKVLDEAVMELKSEEFSDLFKDSIEKKQIRFDNEEVIIDIGDDAYIPQLYIQSETERFQFYKRMYNSRENEELQAIINELKDRFGKIPTEVKSLIFVVRIRMLAIPAGFSRIIVRSGKLQIELPDESNSLYYEKAFPALADFLQTCEYAILNQKGKKLFIDFTIKNKDEALEILWRINKTIKSISNEVCR
jgi:transcription-repair coupling factor (superfamily II helicase)